MKPSKEYTKNVVNSFFSNILPKCETEDEQRKELAELINTMYELGQINKAQSATKYMGQDLTNEMAEALKQ